MILVDSATFLIAIHSKPAIDNIFFFLHSVTSRTTSNALIYERIFPQTTEIFARRISLSYSLISYIDSWRTNSIQIEFNI